MSYTVYGMILSYRLFYCVGVCDLVCGAVCIWRGLCLVIWSDITKRSVRSDNSLGKSSWIKKRLCGAICWFDMWYYAVRGILFDCRAYFWVMQNVIPDWSRFPKWECGRAVWCVGGCGSMGGLIDYVGLWDLYCDLLWHDNGIWFLSAVRCMVVWFGWSGLTLYSLGYIWVGCGNVFFCGCQSGSYAEHFFLIYVVDRVWFFDCVVYRACVRCCWYILVF